jgi:hypothetical protein
MKAASNSQQRYFHNFLRTLQRFSDAANALTLFIAQANHTAVLIRQLGQALPQCNACFLKPAGLLGDILAKRLDKFGIQQDVLN